MIDNFGLCSRKQPIELFEEFLWAIRPIRIGQAASYGRQQQIMTNDPTEIVQLPDKFMGTDLTVTISRIESAVRGLSVEHCGEFLESEGVDGETLAAAVELKSLASQINVTIHALGILVVSPTHSRSGGNRGVYLSGCRQHGPKI